MNFQAMVKESWQFK
ncbi:Protein of unknown function [Lactobacillus delbrueckii subsp. lactis]|nr:Protein of unknown function [Lactobacillus delbrueckii subsp. bulgaricus]CDR77022.1 Putative uncharacterized protein [Lactobacillus delbrueckii subsp. lactis]CDR74769.1 Protein of unknown function [Lactobacillus delbrueckii subsp. bulgaricus]CDR80785.1 Protein of unknown function [Lactobacillus delbrueckii subsp. lactis]CDR81931.1 Protein of unknown function [Lactobacillus delbrueckii subsp. lactis]